MDLKSTEQSRQSFESTEKSVCVERTLRHKKIGWNKKVFWLCVILLGRMRCLEISKMLTTTIQFKFGNQLVKVQWLVRKVKTIIWETQNHSFKGTDRKGMSNEWDYLNYELNNKILSFCNVVMPVCGGSVCPENLNKKKQNKWKWERQRMVRKFNRYGVGLNPTITKVKI